MFVQADVRHAAGVEALISQAVESYGRLGCAHNDPGISALGIAGNQRALTAEYPDAQWRQVIAIHLTGIWLCMNTSSNRCSHKAEEPSSVRRRSLTWSGL
jgi:NAD(P)-dependent dehydrogenase (short-subunit alcohol dehydrogenase family)